MVKIIQNFKEIYTQSNRPNDIGSALKTVYDRLANIQQEDPVPVKKQGCLHCTHFVRDESYNQQWGMWQFYNCYCELGIKGKYIDKKCCKFNLGDNKLNYVSTEEKLETEYYASLGYYKSKGITFEEFLKKQNNGSRNWRRSEV